MSLIPLLFLPPIRNICVSTTFFGVGEKVNDLVFSSTSQVESPSKNWRNALKTQKRPGQNI